MITERVEFDTPLAEDDRLAWCDWLHHHGVDPNDVAVPGWIERREGQCQVAWLAFGRDEDRRVRLDVERDEPVREVHVQQLEARPSPWPVRNDRSA